MTDNTIRELISQGINQTGVAESPAADVKIEKETNIQTDESGVTDSPVEPKGEETKTTDDSGSVEYDLSEEELKHIDPELREILSKADAEVRKAQINVFKKMRASHDRKLSEIGEDKKLAEEIKGELTKHGLALNPNDIKGLIAFDAMYRKDPKQAVKVLADKHKLAIAEEKEAEEELYLTPEEEKLLKGQKALEDQVREINERERRREQEISDQLVLKFIEEKDEKGNLKHPHFEKVSDQMIALAKVHKQLSIKELYEQAVWLNPEIRNQILSHERKKALDEVEAKRKAEVEKVKSISSQRIKSTPAQTQAMDIRSIIRRSVESYGA